MSFTRSIFNNSVFFLALIPLFAVWGFWVTYFTRPAGSIAIHEHLHGVAMFAWLGLLVLQAFLIRTNRRSLHRQTGIVLQSNFLFAGSVLENLRFFPGEKANDPEFAQLFKVAADFEDYIPRNAENIERQSRWLATTIREENLRHVSAEGLARLVEESARHAGDADRLSSDINYMADVVREAHYWAERAGADLIGAKEIDQAIESRIRRGSRVRDRLQEETLRETLRIETSGSQVGQINGLAVMQLGGQAFGIGEASLAGEPANGVFEHGSGAPGGVEARR